MNQFLGTVGVITQLVLSGVLIAGGSPWIGGTLILTAVLIAAL